VTLVAEYSALSDIGLHRRTNEDAVVVTPPLFAVCDGMGGALAGEVASGLAAETLAAGVAGGLPLLAAAEEANAAVFARARADSAHAGMGTTLTAVLLEADTAHFVHVGDSRAYLVRGGELMQVTDDHSMVAEMVRGGRLTEEEAAVHPHRSVLSRALGTEAKVRLDEFAVDLLEGDVLLLCSDGLSGPVPAAGILDALTIRDVDAAAAKLIGEARRLGGPDNITALVLRFEAATARVADTGVSDPEVTEAGVPDLEAADAGVSGLEAADVETRSAQTGSSMDDVLPGGEDDVPGAEAPAALGSEAEEAESLAAPPVVAARPRRRRLLVLAGVLAILCLAGLVGSVIISTVFFVSVDEGRLAVFSGLPVEIGPVPLHVTYRSSARLYSSLSERERAIVDARSLRSRDGATEVGRDLGMWP
jgi:protein phosphatase